MNKSFKKASAVRVKKAPGSGETGTFLGAAGGGDLADVKAFVRRYGRDHINDALYHAARGVFPGCIDVAKYLLKQGADINHAAEYNQDPLRNAVAARSREMISFLISHGASTGSCRRGTGDSIVMYAIYSGADKNVIECLLAAGADLDIRDRRGLTALQIAKKNDMKNTATMLEKEIFRRALQIFNTGTARNIKKIRPIVFEKRQGIEKQR